MKYHLFIDSNNRISGTHSNFYYNVEGFLPIQEYSMYTVNVEYVIIFNNQSTDTVTNLPYDAYTYNIMIDLNKQQNILSNDSYINIFSDSTENYTRQAYWRSDTNVVVYYDKLSNNCLVGKNGPKITAYMPKPTINIKILDEHGAELLDTLGGVVPRVKMLLKFKPFI